MKQALLSLFAAFALSAAAAAAPKPNIVFILADDLGYGDVGCYGQQKIQTPNIDRLAAEGMKFTHFYSGASVCAPSRCVLMTGKHGGRCRVRGNAPTTQRLKQSLMSDDVTVAAMLKKAGYATALVGKWGLGDHDTPGHPLLQGFDFFFGYLDQVDAHVYYPEWLWRNREKVKLPNNVRPIPVGKDGAWGTGGIASKKVAYSPKLMLDEALAFIERSKAQPFFLYFATTIPHANNEAAKELGNGAEVPDLGIYKDKPWPEPEKGYAAMITYLDAQVGVMLRRLKALGLDDNTLVFFSSDNGPELKQFAGYDTTFFKSSGPYRGFKRDHLDGGIRMPFIARWPGKIKAGSVTVHVGYFGDFMATAAELADIKVPSGLDSISFAPTLLGRAAEQQRHERLYWEYHAAGSSQAVLLDGRWKALRNERRSAPLELYDLQSDPGETNSIAASHPDIVAKAEAALKRERVENENWPLRDAPTPKPATKEPVVPPPPRAVLDLTLQPPVVITAPGAEFQDEARHGAMILGMDRTPKGRIWGCWTGNGDKPDAYFLLATSDDGGTTWSKPRLAVGAPDPTGKPQRRALVGNVWTDPLGRVWLFFDQSLVGFFDGRAGSWYMRCDNPDAVEPVWSKPVRIADGCTLCKPTVLKNGAWLLPVALWTRDKIKPLTFRDAYHDLDPNRMAHVFVSTDQGRTWTRRGGVAFPESDFDEHMMVELRDGRLWMLARTKYGMAESVSPDKGRTWTEPKPAAIKNVSARFFIRQLASGRLLLVKNGPTTERLPKRSHMSAFLSDDDGRTWHGGLMFDERASVSYPDGFQAPDGLIHILYDWNRHTDAEILMVKFREEDVLAGKFVSPDAKPRFLVNKALGPKPKPAPVRIILDTDMSGDCDDAGTLALLHALADRDECELLAVVTNRKDKTNASAAAVDAINTYYGRPNIPIGTDKVGPTDLQRTSAYTRALRDEFPHDAKPDDQMPDALDVYRRVLAAQPDDSVTICSVGAFSNLAELWRREPALVLTKVHRLVVMGGEFPTSKRPETNVRTHREAARVVTAEWPTELVWHGFEIGNVLITGAGLKNTPKDNPVRRAYELKPFGKRPAIEGGQPSWDQGSALYAVRGAEPEFWRAVRGGRVTVDEEGVTTWESGPITRHYYAKIKGEPAKLAAVIESLMIQPPKHGGRDGRQGSSGASPR